MLIPWMDKHGLRPGCDWDDQLVEAVRSCRVLLFVMTPDSVETKSMCKGEWTRALRYKKPVIPLLLTPGIEVPLDLERRQYINCSGDFQTALEQLCRHIKWLSTPAGQRHQINDRLADANRALRRASDEVSRARIQDEIAILEKQIVDQGLVLDDSPGATRRIETNIARDLHAERTGRADAEAGDSGLFINPPPMISPTYFQDRIVETKQIASALKDESIRLAWVVGRGGVGKTTLICRLLKSLERGKVPGSSKGFQVVGIVYLSAVGTRRATFSNLFTDLCKLLPGNASAELHSLYSDPGVTTESKMQHLLTRFTSGHVVVLLDALEDLLSSETGSVADVELHTALRVMLTGSHHTIKVIVTTRLVPPDLAQIHPGRQQRVDLDEGLESPHAEEMLRSLDSFGKVGLKAAPDSLLKQARERTRGFPKALESLFGILSVDRDASLAEILDDTRTLLPERVFDALVGEAFSRLDAVSQEVMQAIAIYGRPVPPVAVDFLMQPFRTGFESGPILRHLVNMKFVHKESGRYYLHPVDREYALSRIVPGHEDDRQTADGPVFTRFALYHRAAVYYMQTRKLKPGLKTIEDLSAPFAEFEMHYAAHEFGSAAKLLDEIESVYYDLQGNLQTLIELRERLIGKLLDTRLAEINAGRLGQAYRAVGQLGKAMPFLEDALRIARANDEPRNVTEWLASIAHNHKDLGNMQMALELSDEALALARSVSDDKLQSVLVGFMAHCKEFMGEPGKAIPLFELALEKAASTKDAQWQCANLNGLATSYFCMGQVIRAKEYAERALAIARTNSLRLWLSSNLGILSNCHNDLGQTDKALECLQEALAITRQTGQRALEAFRCLMLALIHVSEGQYAEALSLTLESKAISEVIDQPKLPSFCFFALAQIHYRTGDLSAARASAESACESVFPENLHNASVLLGLIALKQGDQKAAREALQRAVQKADQALTLNDSNANALDCKGLALCGLALCGDKGLIPHAASTYHAARAINRHPGVTKNAVRWLDTLAILDNTGLLEGARRAAAGE